MSTCLVKQNDGTWVEKDQRFLFNVYKRFLIFVTFFTFFNVFLFFFSGTFFTSMNRITYSRFDAASHASTNQFLHRVTVRDRHAAAGCHCYSNFI